MIIPLELATERGSDVGSQFQIGERVLFSPEGMEKPGLSMIEGYVCAVKFTASHVFYDIAVPFDDGSHCRVITGLRCYMESVETGDKTNFQDVSINDCEVKH